jgi:hypothetical protein
VPIWVEFRTQLFVGPEGSGTLAMALPTHNTFYVAIKTEKIMVTNQACNLKFKNITS